MRKLLLVDFFFPFMPQIGHFDDFANLILVGQRVPLLRFLRRCDLVQLVLVHAIRAKSFK